MNMGPSKSNEKDWSAYLASRPNGEGSSPFLFIVLHDRSSTHESATRFDGVKCLFSDERGVIMIVRYQIAFFFSSVTVFL